MSGFRNQWTSPKAPPGFRQFWGSKPSGVAPLAACTVTASGSYRCPAPTTPSCDLNNITATNLGKFAFNIADGSSECIAWNAANGNAGHIIPVNSSFSISLWLRFPGAGWRGRYCVWDGVNTSGWVQQTFLGKRYNDAVYFSSNTIGDLEGASGRLSSDNTWYHIGVTYDTSSGVTIVYFNGAADGTSTLTAGGCNNVGPSGEIQSAISVPTAAYISNKGVQGDVDDIGVWDDVLSAANMASLYNSGNGAKCNTVAVANLVHYIDFEIGPGNEPTDTIVGGLGDGVYIPNTCDPATSPQTCGIGAATPDPCTYE